LILRPTQCSFAYFGYGEELSAIIGRKVDFCSRLHPLILDRVKEELFPVHDDSVDHDVIWGVLDVEAGELRESVQVTLAREFLQAPPP
jgi:hypothetical protein